MKTVLAAVALAATMVGGSVAANATTIAFPSTTTNADGLVHVGNSPSTGVTQTGSGTTKSFTYDFAFMGGVSLDGISASASTRGVTFSSVAVLGVFAPISVSGSSFTLFSGDPGSFSNTILPAGSFTLEIKGSTTNTAGRFNGNLTVSAVPLPSTVAMFGTAVLGLGLAGVARRKSKAVSASV